MRLICPNCDAQYEVPENVIPEHGRDVQCSNCGQTWFQDHPNTIAEREAAQVGAAHDDEEVEAVTKEVESDTDAQDDQARAVDAPGFAPEDTGTKQRQLDPNVADILQEEAELENRARQKESEQMESQPELGLTETDDEGEKRAREARERMARMRGEEPEPPLTSTEASTSLGSRRDLLPDIEEINSTLRSNSNRSPSSDPGQTAQIEVQEKRSSRRGFILTIALVSVLALVYTYAPQLIETVPAAEPILTGYVAMIDSWRVWLDGHVSSLLTWLDATAASSNQ